MGQHAIEVFYPQSESIDHFNHWIIEIILPYITGRVLETNSDRGAISSKLIEQGFTVQLNAASESNRNFLQDKFKEMPLVRGIHKINFLNPRMELKYLKFQDQFQTIIALGNIEENTFYDKSSIDKARRLLKVGGNMIVLGKAQSCFFPGSEIDFIELKKYNWSLIQNLLHNCEVLITRFFDRNGLYFIAVGEKIAG